LPVLRAIEAEPALRLALIVGGTHLAPDFGHTVDRIERDGFRVDDRVEMLLASDSPLGIAKSMGLATMSFAESYARNRPDLLVVTGDRFEMHAAALAALPFTIPVAHLHGGELTAGAIDDALRHSLTKLSHLHFTATADAHDRVVSLGEEPWRVVTSGAPSLDNIAALPRLGAAELTLRIGMPLDPAPLLVTFHPVTLQHERTAAHIGELLAALDAAGRPVIFTLPNADTAGRIVRERIIAYAAQHADARISDNLGSAAYFSLMTVAAAMVGNSSSGIIEAASFGLPVVNVGDRQLGRLQARNVIDAVPERGAVLAAIRRACSGSFRAGLTGLVNPYGCGHAAAVIVERLRDVPLDETLSMKRFHPPAHDRARYA
jgi:UDP-hydrolysing UDP-N-acetyl-D-glucosamine 2-epimerase